LASPEPEVLCLRGKWGVGKTFSWMAFLREAKDKGEIALESYSYVSLFGIDSLDQLKYSIFENSIARDVIGTEPHLRRFSQT
jgi:tRNA A37 threonylcarbamoyladenosine biosynthesis protein TsaE